MNTQKQTDELGDSDRMHEELWRWGSEDQVEQLRKGNKVCAERFRKKEETDNELLA